jgi:hypothetical protein
MYLRGGDKIDRDIVHLLKRGPDPLRCGHGLVHDMHTNKANRDVTQDLPAVQVQIHDLCRHGEKSLRPVAFVLVDYLPSQLYRERAARLSVLLTGRKTNFPLMLNKSDLSINIKKRIIA